MILKELTFFLESIAPLAYQEDYDNAGLIVGQPEANVDKALITLDCTETIVEEAVQKGCGLIISHHPVLFKGLKKFNNHNYVERVIAKALKNDIAIYAIHTNLDNVYSGVNAKLCRQLSLLNYQVLAPKGEVLRKLVTYVPLSHAELVRTALFSAGAGCMGKYSECSFNTTGTGTFKPWKNAHPFVGAQGEHHREDEVKIETIYPFYLERLILKALLKVHPYEEVAYDLYALHNTHAEVGSGMIGHLEKPMQENDFLAHVKQCLRSKVIRHSSLSGKTIQHVAVCGGAGSFLLQAAIHAGADAFITADIKYHDFFDASGKLLVADVGHFESEQFTQNLIYEAIQGKFPNFALHLTEHNTNPINYFF